MGHVAERVEMHEARHRGDHDQHDRGQTVHADRPIGAQCAAFNKAQDLDLLGRAVQRQEDHPRQEGREEQEPRGDPLGGFLADDLPAETAEDGTHQRGE